MTVFAATGHRPEKLGGYTDIADARLTSLARAFLVIEKPEKIISGMALGWDMSFAAAAVSLNIPFVAAVPFAGQDGVWPSYARARYATLIKQAAEVVVVSAGGFGVQKMQARNEWMVDRCDELVALWDGSTGGTDNCIRYAKRQGRPYRNLWPLFVSMSCQGGM